MNKHLRHFGHRFFPFLVKPYRKIRFTLIDLFKLPAELKEVKELACKQLISPSQNKDVFVNYYSEFEDIQQSEKVPGIVFMVDGRMLHGGPTDRLRGILTTYSMAKRRGIPFHIYWTYPFDLQDYLLPAGIDWHVDASQLTYSRKYAFPVVIMQTGYPQHRLINYLRLIAGIKNAAFQTHIYSNSDNKKGSYARLYHELFKPSPRLEAAVNHHLSKIGEKYWSFTFRFLQLLGDFPDHQDLILDETGKNNLIQKSIRELIKLMKKMPSDYKALVTSDSHTFLSAVASLNEPRIYIVPGKVANIDLQKGNHEEEWLKTFIDQQLIMHAEKVFLMKSGKMYRSGFPRFAAEIGEKPFFIHKY